MRGGARLGAMPIARIAGAVATGTRTGAITGRGAEIVATAIPITAGACAVVQTTQLRSLEASWW